MKNSKLMTGLSLMLTLLMFNCNTPSNLLHEGDYDEAVYAAIKNLRKNKKKKEKDIIVVEEAYRKITARDMNEIDALIAEDQPMNWVKINQIHNHIKERQDLISPYLPLVATKTKYKADFRFVRIVPIELDSRKKAAEYYYQNGKGQMAKALQGDKSAARSAHRKFVRVQNYFGEYKDNNELMESVFEIGLDKIEFEMRNSSFAFIPNGFEDEILSFNERSLNNKWTRYYRSYNAPTDIDYKVIVDVTDIDVSPERVDRNKYKLSKELHRTKTVKVPNKGNRNGVSTTRDSLQVSKPKEKPETETIKVPYTVFAQVVDVHQTKSAYVQAKVSVYESQGKTLLKSDYLNATMEFSNVSSTFRGDKRALTPDVSSRLNAGHVYFPRDDEMVLDAAALLKQKIGNNIRNTNSYVLR